MNWRRMRKHRIAWINARLINVKARETMCVMIRALIYVRDDALFREERFGGFIDHDFPCSCSRNFLRNTI